MGARTNTTLKLKISMYERLADERNWRTNQQQAEATGLGIATISRLRNGLQVPGSQVIGALLTAFDGVAFEDLFEVVVVEELSAA